MCGKWILAHICYAFGFAPRTGCDITPHKATPLHPNGTTAEYVDVYSPLLYTPTPQVVDIATTAREKMKSWWRIPRSSKSTMSSRHGLAANPESVACEGRV
jgi:hypothetical protein